MIWKILSETVSRDESYKVFLINDLHINGKEYSTDTGGLNGERYYYASPNLLRDFVKIVNEEKPDLVMVLGDMCDIPSDWDLFNAIWSDIDQTITQVKTIGNHDLSM